MPKQRYAFTGSREISQEPQAIQGTIDVDPDDHFSFVGKVDFKIPPTTKGLVGQFNPGNEPQTRLIFLQNDNLLGGCYWVYFLIKEENPRMIAGTYKGVHAYIGEGGPSIDEVYNAARQGGLPRLVSKFTRRKEKKGVELKVVEA